MSGTDDHFGDVTSPWLRPVRSGGRSDVGQVLFFPPAGGNASEAWTLESAIPDEWALWGVQYPGRGPRLREPSAKSIRELAEACLPAVLAKPGLIVLFGHSFGAFVAYELAWLLEHRGRQVRLLVAGSSAPGAVVPERPGAEWTDERLIDFLARRGGTSGELLVDDELMRLTLVALRTDLTLAASYVDDWGGRLATGIAALGGRRDPAVTVRQLATWRERTTSWLGVALCDGDHFFYRQDRIHIAVLLNRHWPVIRR